MRKRLAGISVVAIVCLATLALAAPDPSRTDSKTVTGVISQVDLTAKSMVVKESSGTEVTVFWNDATRVTGDLREGSAVKVTAKEEGGKTWATSIDVQAKKPY